MTRAMIAAPIREVEEESACAPAPYLTFPRGRGKEPEKRRGGLGRPVQSDSCSLPSTFRAQRTCGPRRRARVFLAGRLRVGFSEAAEAAASSVSTS